MPHSTCSEAPCQRSVLARGLCSSHYSTWHRNTHRNHDIECAGCGIHFQHYDPARKYCSTACSAPINFAAARVEAVRQRKDRDQTQPERDASRRRWSPLRRAIEADDGQGIIEAVRDLSIIDSEGCWLWTRRQDKSYPVTRFGTKNFLVHRIMLEAKLGAPLGSQQSHHICANTRCVNPDHLALATNAENTAEMKARTDYIRRIEELEVALRELDSGHPLLRQAPLNLRVR